MMNNGSARVRWLRQKPEGIGSVFRGRKKEGTDLQHECRVMV